MKREGPNLAASVRQRLLDVARASGEDFQYVLTRFGLERLLYRLAESPYADQFVLKGAVLFQLWTDTPHRPTRDVDFLGHGSSDPERLAKLIAEVCAANRSAEDGLEFVTSTLRADQIKEEDEYHGIRIRLEAILDSARIPLQIDVGFGDAITPLAEDVEYPVLLGHAPPRLKAYPRETVVAEKFQAMVMLGMANSRMKDFFDLYVLATQFAFAGPIVASAIAATFARRETELPIEPPLALTDTFARDAVKQRQWQAFLQRSRLDGDHEELVGVIELLQRFLMPAATGASDPNSFHQTWNAGGPWKPND